MNNLQYKPLTREKFIQSSYWEKLNQQQQNAFCIVSQVLPFRANTYVLDNLIDWSRIPEDSIYQLIFPQREMLTDDQFEQLENAAASGNKELLEKTIHAIRLRMNPHPAGQLEANQPHLRDGTPLSGIQHKYQETLLFFPAAAQTCHAYCSFCFRWPQFVNMPGYKFQAKESEQLSRYLRENPQVSDVLFTGGDPMVMNARSFASYIEPILDIDSIKTIRIGTKSLSYWPYRYLSDKDTEDLFHLFEKIIQSGRHLAIMAHFNHPCELRPAAVRQAIKRLNSIGATIRIQAPILKHINDKVDNWRELWTESVRLGCVPYYMFVERDTGPKHYFDLPLVTAYTIYKQAYMQTSGLSRTVRGPSMSTYWGKISVEGICNIAGQKTIALKFLQARDPEWTGQIFFAQYDEAATWIDELKPLSGDRFFFQSLPAQSIIASDTSAVKAVELLEL